MDWMRTHPYHATLVVAGMLIIAGAVLVETRSKTPTPAGVSAWSGNVATYASSSMPSTEASIAQTITSNAVSGNYGTATLPYTAPATATSSQGTIPTGDSDVSNGSFDFNAFLAGITQKASPTTSDASATSTSSSASLDSTAWNYIPSGLISTITPSDINKRTPTQQALYEYGNEIGSYIEGYDAAHTNQAAVLSDAMNDRQNATKARAMAQIGQDLETVGAGIAETTDVPAAAAADNAALSASYNDIGTKLVAVSQSLPLSDSTLVSAIETYGAALDTFNQKYIAIAMLLESEDVTFSSGDPGSVFSFTPSAL